PGAAGQRVDAHGPHARVPPVVLGEHGSALQAPDTRDGPQQGFHLRPRPHGRHHGSAQRHDVLPVRHQAGAGGHGHHLHVHHVLGDGSGVADPDLHLGARHLLQAARRQLLPHGVLRPRQLGEPDPAGAHRDRPLRLARVLHVRLRVQGGRVHHLPRRAAHDEPHVRRLVLLPLGGGQERRHREPGVHGLDPLLHHLRRLHR
ncbi:Atp-binding protein, partial [Globisporangium polare]